MQRVEALGAPAQRLGERGRADGHQHELLQLELVVGVRAAVDHVHHRRRQHVRVRAAEVAVERLAGAVGRRARDGERDAEDGVRAERVLVGRAVEVEQRAIDARAARTRRGRATASAIGPFTLATACETPLPP